MGPWPWSEGEETVDRPIPVRVIAGGKDRGASEREGFEAQLLVALGGVGMAIGGQSAMDRVQRRRSTAFWWRWGEEVEGQWLRSSSVIRRSYCQARLGRSSGEAADLRRAAAHRR